MGSSENRVSSLVDIRVASYPDTYVPDAGDAMDAWLNAFGVSR